MYTLTMYMFFVAFIPSINNIIGLQNGVTIGLKRSFPFILGVCFGHTFLNVLFIFVGSTIFENFPIIIPFLKTLCVIYLLWLAYQIVRFYHIKSRRLFHTSFTTGFGLQLINIQTILSTMSAIIIFVYPYHKGFWIPLALYISLFSLLAMVSWTLLGSVFKRTSLKNKRVFSWIIVALILYTCYTIIAK
ncbi:MAG: LysE family translocator [Brevinema sp.]